MATLTARPSGDAQPQEGQILGEISKKSTDERRVLLSILVHHKGTSRPGPGLYGLPLKAMGYDVDEVGVDEFIQMQTERVFAAYSDETDFPKCLV